MWGPGHSLAVSPQRVSGVAQVLWLCLHQNLWEAAAASTAQSLPTRMPNTMHSLRRSRYPNISSATFSGTIIVPCPLLFHSSRILAGSQKAVLQRSKVAKETCLHPVSFFCLFSSLVVPVLPLSPPPPHFPFLVSSSPSPFCLPVLSLFPSPPFWPLISCPSH